MLGAKRRHRSQNQAERRPKPARLPSRCIYPKTAARKLHQSRSVHRNQNPQNGQHWARFDWGSGAICFGASPVAAVFGSAPESATPLEHRIHSNPAPHAPPSKQDISTLLGIGHFYFALTGFELGWNGFCWKCPDASPAGCGDLAWASTGASSTAACSTVTQRTG